MISGRGWPFFGKKFFKFFAEIWVKSAGKYKGEEGVEKCLKSTRGETKFLGIFGKFRLKLGKNRDFWELSFTCVILLFDFVI